MVRINKELYEVSHLEIGERLREIAGFLSQTKSFSVKVNSHIKIMANLVNNLIPSEDHLELTDQELRVQSHPKRSKGTKSDRKADSGENQLITQLFSNFKAENDKLWGVLEKNEKNTEFLQGCFDKLIDMSKGGGSVIGEPVRQQDNVNNIHTYGYDPEGKGNAHNFVTQHHHHGDPHTTPRRGNMTVYGNQHYGQQPGRFYSVYEPRPPSRKSRRDNNDDGFGEEQTIRSLKDELGRMNREIRMLQREKDDEESGMQNIVKKLIEVKGESEDIIKKKDEKIEELLTSLGNVTAKVSALESELSFLRENNKTLEKTVKEVFGGKTGVDLDHSGELDELKDELDELRRKNRKLEKKLASKPHDAGNKNIEDFLRTQAEQLKEQLDESKKEQELLEEKNDRLCSLLEKQATTKSRKTDTYTTEDFDLLKCVYAQALYIEDFIGYNAHLTLGFKDS